MEIWILFVDNCGWIMYPLFPLSFPSVCFFGAQMPLRGLGSPAEAESELIALLLELLSAGHGQGDSTI